MTCAGIRREPCSACPYRCDVPSGVWSEHEYRKLPPYDAETYAQPIETFRCHATPDHLCHGWAVVGGWDLLALRLAATQARDGRSLEVPPAAVPLFPTHTAAAEHGLAELDEPSETAREAIERLLRVHPRLTT